MDTELSDDQIAYRAEQQRLAGLYHALFHVDKRGHVVLDDLIRKFARGPARGFSQEAITETFVRAHQREVFDYIDAMVTLAEQGADELPTTERQEDDLP